MNKRLQKKAEKNRRAVVHKLFDIVLDVNGIEKRQRGKTGNKPTAFLSFSGHIANISISLYPDGWDRGGIKSQDYWINLVGNKRLNIDIEDFERDARRIING